MEKTTSQFVSGCFAFCLMIMTSSAYAAVLTHDESIIEDTTWAADDVHIVNGNITVNDEASLTIEAGSVIKFEAGSQLNIAGALVAEGTENAKIIFTSYRDDSVGGDTNGNGTSETGVAGDWKNITFNQSSDEGLTKFNYVQVRYAGEGNSDALVLNNANIEVSFCDIKDNAHRGISVYSDSAIIRNCNVSDNGHEGIQVIGSNVSIADNTISNNAKSGLYVFAYSGSPVIKNNVISGNDWGIYYHSYNFSDTAAITGNTVKNNTAPLHISVNALPKASDNNVFGPNTRNAIWLVGAERVVTKSLQLDALDLEGDVALDTYYLERGSLFMAKGTKLTINAGVIVKFNSHTSFRINGQLSAVGTEDKPIVFTSVHDDSYGGDFNLNGADTFPAHGDWQGIQLGENSTENVLEHAVLRYGGGDYDANIVAFKTALQVKDSLISNSGTRGIESNNSSITLENTEIFANSAEGVYAQQSGRLDITGGRIYANFSDGVYYSGDVAGRIKGTQVFANLGAGLQNKGSKEIDARGNWWGALDGPSGDEAGSGALVKNTGSGAILVSNQEQGVLTDGTKFNLFDAGGSQYDNYGINVPVATGEPSDEWGESPQYTVLEESSSRRITLEYAGLEADTAYDVLFTYLNKRSEEIKQRTNDGKGQEVHPSLPLPKYIPSVYRYPVTPDSIVDGKLKLDIQALQGPEALVSMVYLLKKGSNDIVPPAITINQPADNFVTNLASQTIVGEVSEKSTLTINGSAVTVEDDLSFSHTLTLREDENLISVEAIDLAGNSTVKTIAGKLDLSAPTITVTGPTNNLVTKEPSQTITGRLSEAGTLTINDAVVTVEADLSFSHTITLSEGNNTFNITAADVFANSASQVVTLTLDTKGPVFTNLTPSNNSVLAQNITAITGRLSEGSQLKINGTAVALDDLYNFSYSTSLIDGEQSYTLEAIDVAGNKTSQTLDLILNDGVAPTLLITSPQNGLVTNQSEHVLIGHIDEAAIVSVNGKEVAVNNDLSFNVPITLTSGENTFTIVARDAVSNTATSNLIITLDNGLPAAPIVTSHSASPDENLSNQRVVTLSGSREANTSIWINGVEKVTLGSTDWRTGLTLSEGRSTVNVVAKDLAANSSVSTVVKFNIDTISPVVTSVTPSTVLNNAPSVIQVSFTEEGSVINSDNTQFIVVRNGNVVEGNLTVNSESLIFTPTAEFEEGVYTVRPELVDKAGNHSVVKDYSFTLDFTAPSVPTLSAYSATTNNSVITFNGTKDAETAIVLNGSEIVAHTSNTTWSYQAELVSGSNDFAFRSQDVAGNDSDAVNANIVLDDIAPGAVTLEATNQGSGTTINLAWASYDEAINGSDIKEYRVYQAGSDFTDILSANLIATVEQGNKAATAIELTRNQTYYFAVVAVDSQNQFLTNVTAIAATPIDNIAPSQVENLSVASFADHLDISWTSLASIVDDLSAYKLYVDNAATGIELPASAVSYELKGLNAATAYSVRLTAVDNDGNENEGVSIAAATLLSNPAITSTESLSGLVALTWEPSQPAALVNSYNIYAESSDFGNSITGLTPKTTVTANKLQASVLNLNNGSQYWFAVTAVNISGGETAVVTSTVATPTADSEGPEIRKVSFDGEALTANYTITKLGSVLVDTSDRTGVSRVELLIDNSLVVTDNSGSNSTYNLPFNILAVSDGVHSLTVRAIDTLGNETNQAIEINVALAAPAIPDITQPAESITANQQQFTISGKAELNTQVKIYNNGIAVGPVVDVNSQGAFSSTINLVEGENIITATAAFSNRSGESNQSASRIINVDLSVPDLPLGLTATSRVLGEVRLTWNSVADPRVQGYNVYRSATPFELTSEAGVVKLNDLFVTDEAFTDLPASDGTYYYRVTSVNELASESAPSQQVEAVSDSVGPRALSIKYTADGKTDAQSGRVAPGLVLVEITFDEPLRNVPYFAITPNAGVPIVITLTKDRNDDRVYKGNFVLQSTTPSGDAFAVLSAYDQYNNRGTEIDSGARLLVDTHGPEIVELTLTPTHPIKVDPLLGNSERTISISIRLDDAVANGLQPRLTPQLDGVVIPGYIDGIDLTRDSASPDNAPIWKGDLILPQTAGQSAVQVLSFSHSAFDDLDNEGTKINGVNQFQVYQGDLPPVAIPFNLTAKALAGGDVELNWQAVEEASGYKLYRQAANESEMTELIQLDGSNSLTFTDKGLADNLYNYAITSTRMANNQQSESALSNSVTVIADGTAPNAPQNLQLELNGAGTVLRWLAPTGELDISKVSYNLYRLSIDEGDVVDLQGIEPLQTSIPNLAEPIALDKQPNRNARTYVVTAVDAAGNESLVSNAVTQELQLLPVSNLAISLPQEGYPELSWTHNDSNVKQYDIYAGSVTEENKLNVFTITDSNFTDTSYNDGSPSNGAEQQRRYIVVAIDDQDTRSIGHSLVLPALNVSLNEAASQQLDRGIMNKLVFRVDNEGSAATHNQRLFVTIDDNGSQRQHQSESFSVDAGSFTLVSVVVGGYASLDSLGELHLSLRQTPQAGEQVTIQQSDSITVSDNALAISMNTEEFTRGATGKVRFTVENTSEVETELLLARNNGNKASSEVRLIIEDLDGNRLSTQAIHQFGGGAVTTINGNSVARIPAGASFTSDLIQIPIPGAAPDKVQLRLEIDAYHHHLDRTDHVQILGSEVRKEVSLIDTEYFAKVTNISESIVYGTTPITITGQSIDRVTEQPLAGVPVKLVFRVSGFERSVTVTTDSNGEFKHQYVPSNNESGRYQVSAVHPDMVDRPNQGEFVIQTVSIEPKQINLNIPQNYDQRIAVKVNTGKETPLTNLRIEYRAEDQINGLSPKGISIDPGVSIDVLASRTAYLRPVFRADQTAELSGIVRLRVMSDNRLEPLAFATLNYALSAAEPSLAIASPGYMETGVGLGKSITEQMSVSNKGLAALHNVQLSLTKADRTTTAPSWLYLSSGSSVGDMAVGDEQKINVTFNPSTSIAEADYEFWLKISSDELDPIYVPVYAAVTQSGKGNAAFHTSDIYTATLDEYSNPIPGLAGAKIKLQNEQVLTQQYNVTADANGDALFEDIPAGRYIFRASAQDHQDVSGRIVIKPGITVAEEVFLMNNIITVEFSVNEITIQDRYEIILKATYETSVPVAVVVAEPQSVNLPVMKKGETLLGEIRLTNHGLIRADAVTSFFPSSNDLIKFELLLPVPKTLEAGEVVILPYRITALSDFNPETEGDATGGGCGSLSFQHCAKSECTCVNGTVVPGNTCTSFSTSWGTCSGGGGYGGYGYGGGGGGGGGGVSFRGAAQSISSTPQECAAAGGQTCGNTGDGNAN